VSAAICPVPIKTMVGGEEEGGIRNTNKTPYSLIDLQDSPA